MSTDLDQARKDLEAAIETYFRAEVADLDNEAVQTAVVTSWVVGYEISNVVDDSIGYANRSIESLGSPNTHANLGDWIARNQRRFIGGEEENDDDY